MKVPQAIVAFEPSPDDSAFLEDRLYAFNVAATGLDDGRSLGWCVRGESGELLAAIAGHTWGRTCEVKQLWVTDRLRRSGLGGRLLAAAEREARERRCDQIALATHSFQAPDFYRAHGYREAGRIRDYPAGHDQIWFVKPL